MTTKVICAFCYKTIPKEQAGSIPTVGYVCSACFSRIMRFLVKL